MDFDSLVSTSAEIGIAALALGLTAGLVGKGVKKMSNNQCIWF